MCEEFYIQQRNHFQTEINDYIYHYILSVSAVAFISDCGSRGTVSNARVFAMQKQQRQESKSRMT